MLDTNYLRWIIIRAAVSAPAARLYPPMASFEPEPENESSSQPEESIDNSPSDSKWAPTPEALTKLLAAFSPDREEAWKNYELGRQKLIRYFERRSVMDAEHYADVVLDRAMRRIDEGTKIDNLMPYLMTIASYVYLEIIHDQERARESIKNLRTSIPPVSIAPKEEGPSWRCFDECLDGMPAMKRDLIVEYYQEEAHAKIELHKQMAERLGIPLNALRIRVHRIRAELENCMRSCLDRFAHVTEH